MKRFKFFLQKTEEIIIEAEDSDSARMKIIEDERYRWADYVNDGTEIKELDMQPEKCECVCHLDDSNQCLGCRMGDCNNGYLWPNL